MTPIHQVSAPARGSKTPENPAQWGSFSLAACTGFSGNNPNPNKEEGSVHV
jgi:hypothetical protein